MDPIISFVIILIFVTLCTAWLRVPPFLTLIVAALLFGLMTGLGEETIALAEDGAGRIFALLGIPIFCGAVIAQVLRSGGGAERIVSDLGRLSGSPSLTAGAAGYLFAMPFLCCITSFLVLAPIARQMDTGDHTPAYMAAFGSVISFVLLFPLPVTYAIVSTVNPEGFDPVIFSAVAVPLSLILLLLGYIMLRRQGDEKAPLPETEPEVSSWQAWTPVILPFVLIGAGTLIPALHILSSVPLALIAGAIAALLIASGEVRAMAFKKGTRNAGIIIFDLCGAGALGAVIAAGGFAEAVYEILIQFAPVILLPFLLAAMIQTAQGSRVVTAVICATMLTGIPAVSEIPALPLVLMVSAGTLLFSYLSDPYFWLVKGMTGDDVKTVLRRYTLPQACAGFVILLTGLIIFSLA